jgi:hypothetical protein
MTVKVRLADGNTEIFETANYVIGSERDFHPMIMRIEVYECGKRIAVRQRRFGWWYRHFVYPTDYVQDKIRKLKEKKDAE